MPKRDPDFAIKVEKAIAEKFGKETIVNPRSLWSKEKEEKFLEEIKEIVSLEDKNIEATARTEMNGVLVPKKLVKRDKINNICQICKQYSFDLKDDLYLNKFSSCLDCYIKHIEGREEKWKKNTQDNN